MQKILVSVSTPQDTNPSTNLGICSGSQLLFFFPFFKRFLRRSLMIHRGATLLGSDPPSAEKRTGGRWTIKKPRLALTLFCYHQVPLKHKQHFLCLFQSWRVSCYRYGRMALMSVGFPEILWRLSHRAPELRTQRFPLSNILSGKL